MNQQRIERIKTLLTHAFEPTHLDIIDESHLHAGHAGAKSGMGHFAVDIQSKAFVGKRPLERHRMIYAALGDMMQTDIHALRMIRIG